MSLKVPVQGRYPMLARLGGSGPSWKDDAVPSQPGIRQEVFALDEGDVVITFPKELSAESYSDLAAYLDLFKRKMKRRSGAPTGHPIHQDGFVRADAPKQLAALLSQRDATIARLTQELRLAQECEAAFQDEARQARQERDEARRNAEAQTKNRPE